MKGRGRKRACPSKGYLKGGREKMHKVRCATASVVETKTVSTLYMNSKIVTQRVPSI